jgi:ribonucleotide reductase beta subunit family protein with ferritin-like domain
MSGLTSYSLTYKPFKYPWAMQIAEEHEQIHWGTWEAKLQEDVNQWKNNQISELEKQHITQILRIFTQSDVAVGGNYCDIFIKEFKNNEIRNMLLSFANREGTHQRAYALLNDTLGLPEREYSSFLDYKEMKEKIEFMIESTVVIKNKKQKLLFELARSVCNEGMSLFSAFVMLLNYQRFGKMKGMCEIVEWSIRDESTHVNGMTKLFHEYLKENPELLDDNLKAYIYSNYAMAVTLEDALVNLVYRGEKLNELDPALIKRYVRYLADRRLLQLGFKPLFEEKTNPLPWLDWVVSGDSFKNFFEGTVTDYNASGMIGDFDDNLYLQFLERN